MVSNSTYSIITAVATQYVPDKQHELLHVNTYDAWVKTVVNMVEKGSIKPSMAVIVKCALNWETLLTLKYSRLN